MQRKPPTHTNSTNKINTFIQTRPEITLARFASYSHTEKDCKYIQHKQHTHTHKHGHNYIQIYTPELSCLKSTVGLIGSYLVSIELCARPRYIEQNSRSRPKSSSLCEYERKASQADMKTAAPRRFGSQEVHSPQRRSSFKK